MQSRFSESLDECQSQIGSCFSDYAGKVVLLFSFNPDLKSEFLVDLFQAAAPDGTGLEEKEERLPSAILRRKAAPSCLCSFSHSNGGHRTMTNHQSPRSGPSTIREEGQFSELALLIS